MPHSTTEAEDRHSNFYDAWVNLVTSFAPPNAPDVPTVADGRYVEMVWAERPTRRLGEPLSVREGPDPLRLLLQGEGVLQGKRGLDEGGVSEGLGEVAEVVSG